LLHVFRERLDYPDLKRAVKQQAAMYKPKNIVIEDKASGTSLIQDLQDEGLYTVTRYTPEGEKILRMSSVSNMIADGFVHIPAQAAWLPEYLHELATFPNGKYDDQVDSTSQALDWLKQDLYCYGVLDYNKQQAAKMGLPTDPARPRAGTPPNTRMIIPDSRPCETCHGVMTLRIPGGLRKGLATKKKSRGHWSEGPSDSNILRKAVASGETG
jgi:predicted phage terminase large subunit-like protein